MITRRDFNGTDMYVLQVPPFVEVSVATTDEEMGLLRRQYAFVKPPPGGTSRGNLEGVLKPWSQHVMAAAMHEPSPEFRRLDDEKALSTPAIGQAVKGIVDAFDGEIHQDDVFYLVYPPTNSRPAAGIRNALQVAEGPAIDEWEINGVLCRRKRPFTYWLSIPGGSTHDRVKLAFYQSVLFQDDDGPTGWRLLKHSPTQPILRWYVSPDEPVLQGEGTFAVANTFEVEKRSFSVLQDAIERSGTPIYDVDDHPNGCSGFPDYKAVIGTQPWAIEITRPLGRMVHGRVIIMGNEGLSSDIRRVGSRRGLSSSAIEDGLRKATEDKSERRELLAQDEKYCLLLVDTMGLVNPEDPNQWEHCELGAFDSVILVQLMPEHPTGIVAIKGDIPVKSE